MLTGGLFPTKMTRSLRLFVAATALLAVVCLHWGSWSFPTSQLPQFRDALVAFALLSVLSEASYVKLRIGRAATDSSIVFIPFIASILLFESGWSMLVACAVVAFSEQIIRQKAPIKVVFNASQHGISVWAGSTVFRLLGGVPALSVDSLAGSPGLTFPNQPVAIGAGILIYFLVNISAVSVAVALSEGVPVLAAWFRIGGSQLSYDVVSSPLGILLAFLYVKLGMLGVLSTLLPLFFVRHAYRATVQLEDANRELLELMVKVIEARDPYTSGHSQRVSHLASVIAHECGLSSKLTEQIRTAALLHDVGKIYEEYAPLLRKEGKLDATEKALMQTHSLRSAELAATNSAFRGVIVEAIRHHHENFDGSGYPLGLVGKAIPVGARIIMIADTMDAMTTDRPYRKALTFERVQQELGRFSGKQFDPSLVEVALASDAIRDVIVHRTEPGRAAAAPGRLIPLSLRSPLRRRAAVQQ